MIDAIKLELITLNAAEAILPLFKDRLATLDARRLFERMLATAVRKEVVEPFKIEVIDPDNDGRWTILTQPLMTAAEKRQEQERFEAWEREQRQQQSALDQQRAAQHPSSARVVRSETDEAISIDGMIADLAHWQTPPDLFNEGHYGFQRGVADVIRYLKARRRLG